ncbi:hypothetical protein [Clostridium folliculivorans]|uniref:Uncharacterized protein n=1 Tax=Clostridium folliculivorans TaxID=2886038 RepID=A0A9W5Y1M6_9CLOT|nr:hypothetical protein [Clostridium folliculivorans]GKU25074.1 hypothetical protein CFOLD11_19000 [Clostridium folliculivorans]GKU31172.1 hypothetical protein CFB3_32790 [Clostridium folliculivorans]
MKKTAILISGTLVLLISIFVGYRAVRYYSADNYTISEDGNTIISKSGQEYVHDNSDLWLEAIATDKQIGKISDSGSVYSLKDESNLDWVAVNTTDEMTITQIYHKKEINDFSIVNKDIKQIRLIENKGLKQAVGKAVATTEEKNILKELSESLSKAKTKQQITSKNIMSLQLLFDDYKGIFYDINVIISDDKQVYLSDINEDNVVKAGPLVTNWILQQYSK